MVPSRVRRADASFLPSQGDPKRARVTPAEPAPPGYFDGPVPQFSVGDSAPKTQEERLDRQQQDTAALRGVPNFVQPEPSSADVPDILEDAYSALPNRVRRADASSLESQGDPKRARVTPAEPAPPGYFDGRTPQFNSGRDSDQQTREGRQRTLDRLEQAAQVTADDGNQTDVGEDDGDQTDIEIDNDDDGGQKDLKRAELQQELDRQFSTTTTTDSTGQPVVSAATAAPVLRDIPSNNKPGGSTTQWGVQSYGAVRFEPSKTSQSLRQGLVEQRQLADSMYADCCFPVFRTAAASPAPDCCCFPHPQGCCFPAPDCCCFPRARLLPLSPPHPRDCSRTAGGPGGGRRATVRVRSYCRSLELASY
jgi:hypothetical protein